MTAIRRATSRVLISIADDGVGLARPARDGTGLTNTRLRLEQLDESTPQTAVTAGALSVTNNGNHGGTPIIDASET